VSERSPRRLGVRALVCACALAARAQALAGDDPPATSTPTSTAAETPAERGREDEPVELPEVLVRVPRAEARADPAAAASVVSADRFAGEAKGVAELLSTVPGVAITRHGSVGQRVAAVDAGFVC